MASDQDINRIDLQESDVAKDASEVTSVDPPGGSRIREALCDDRDSTDLRTAQRRAHAETIWKSPITVSRIGVLPRQGTRMVPGKFDPCAAPPSSHCRRC